MPKRTRKSKKELWERIEPFVDLPAALKLKWLEDARKFVVSFVPPKKRVSPK